MTAILAAAPEIVRPAQRASGGDGLRFGELTRLTFDDLDVAVNVLRIRPKDGWIPKSGDRRAIPISPEIRTVLDALLRSWRWVVTMSRSASHPESGQHWTERRLLSALKKILGASPCGGNCTRSALRSS